MSPEPLIPQELRLIAELREGTRLLGKLFCTPTGRRVVELACRGRDCQGLCYFDAETGQRLREPLPAPPARWRVRRATP